MHSISVLFIKARCPKSIQAFGIIVSSIQECLWVLIFLSVNVKRTYQEIVSILCAFTCVHKYTI